MSTRRPRTSATAEAAAKKRSWNLSSDADTQLIEEWDVKTELLAEVILGVLAEGDAIMFGSAAGGHAITVTLMAGLERTKEYIRDSVELDRLLGLIQVQIEARREEREPRELRKLK